MPFLFVVLYGLLSGFFDVLPVSSFAHQTMLQNIFGIDDSLHLYMFLIHLASLGAIVFSSMPSITALMREQRFATLPRRRAQGERKFTYELRFVKTAVVAAAISTVIILIIGKKQLEHLWLVGILCILNGVIVLVPEYLPYGNKTAKHMNRIDSVIFGVIGSLSVFPGISRFAVMQSYASLRGVDRSRACNWALLAMIPVLAVMTLFDLVGMFTAGIGVNSFLVVIFYISGAVLSFLGTFGGVTLLRFLSAKVGFAGFGYYSIGAGLLSFFLYLTV